MCDYNGSSNTNLEVKIQERSLRAHRWVGITSQRLTYLSLSWTEKDLRFMVTTKEWGFSMLSEDYL